MAPSSANRAFTFGIGEDRVDRLVQLVDDLGGVPFGAPMPYQALAS